MTAIEPGLCEVGILFGDVAGSTRIYELLGDQRALSVINQCFRIMSEPIAAHGGIVVKTIGDELMAAFLRPVGAFSAAVEMQRKINELPPLPFVENRIKVAIRVGFHYGPALREHQDFFGDTVNVAARMVSLAKGGQIITTGDLIDLLPQPQRSMAVEFDRIEVKGRQEPVRLAKVTWEAEASSATVLKLGKPVNTAAPAVSMGLKFGAREWQVEDTCRTMTIGRDAGCDMQLFGQHASRNHATIEKRRDKWILLDHSTNGTHLVLDGFRPIKLHREECVLSAKGRIIFGKLEDEQAEWADYSIK